MEQTVAFPGLGLEFTLNRVALSLFGLDIYWYGVIIAVGFLIAEQYCVRKAPRLGVDGEKFIDMLFFAVPAALVGARAYYVIFNPAAFLRPDGGLDWGRAVAIWDGGIAVYGSILGALAAAAVFCRVRGVKLWNVLDLGACGLLIGQSVGRWGNFVNVEVFGSVTDLPWRMSGESIAAYLWRHGFIHAPETYQAVADGTLGVHPTFFYESAWNALGLALLMALGRRRRCDGQLFLTYVVWYGVGRAVIEGMRTDTLFFFNTGLPVSQLLAGASALCAAGVLVWRLRTAPPATPPLAPADAR